MFMKTNKLLVPNAEQVIELMKLEIAEEMGITLGADTTARDNGKVGGEMTRRLIQIAKEHLANQSQYVGQVETEQPQDTIH
ncbi:small acid-soluble spore protein, alpha/beta [Bacillus phage vB_BanS_Chewbecca]|uniref:Small acid-soluble spore protein, alpha/beta n=1 Tax=Bacillus phage vB_BanS_Chewbecca TaxID=2894786 RepID=A0AAE9CA65_9CAUD|nr:small acid-soluble spore protein, alpha/beta [Bacillus phage vB_BanS_Chewbecca]UGO46231.1 small acid-soluble spore protein, alpha/beta [Bacillus phage vB_BanS_Chewbecca]